MHPYGKVRRSSLPRRQSHQECEMLALGETDMAAMQHPKNQNGVVAEFGFDGQGRLGC